MGKTASSCVLTPTTAPITSLIVSFAAEVLSFQAAKEAKEEPEMKQTRALPGISLLFLIAQFCLPMANAQYNLAGPSTTQLRTPLINGAYTTAAGTQAAEGDPPAVGDGSVPCPVNPGQLGPSTLIPSVTHTSGSINGGSYVAPYNPANLSLPGQLGPSTYAPPSPSTPGYNPGSINGPLNFYSPPVGVGTVMPGGGIAGFAPQTRWGGQTSRDFGRYKHSAKRSYDFGQGAYYGQTAQDGPWQTRLGAIPTQDLYGRRMSLQNGPGIQTIAPY